jgi:hypothetical protein
MTLETSAALASHNPVIYRERQLGDYLLNGKAPVSLPTEK